MATKPQTADDRIWRAFIAASRGSNPLLDEGDPELLDAVSKAIPRDVPPCGACKSWEDEAGLSALGASGRDWEKWKAAMVSRIVSVEGGEPLIRDPRAAASRRVDGWRAAYLSGRDRASSESVPACPRCASMKMAMDLLGSVYASEYARRAARAWEVSSAASGRTGGRKRWAHSRELLAAIVRLTGGSKSTAEARREAIDRWLAEPEASQRLCDELPDRPGYTAKVGLVTDVAIEPGAGWDDRRGEYAGAVLLTVDDPEKRLRVALQTIYRIDIKHDE